MTLEDKFHAFHPCIKRQPVLESAANYDHILQRNSLRATASAKVQSCSSWSDALDWVQVQALWSHAQKPTCFAEFVHLCRFTTCANHWHANTLLWIFSQLRDNRRGAFHAETSSISNRQQKCRRESKSSTMTHLPICEAGFVHSKTPS
jgi:hypothetical protein